MRYLCLVLLLLITAVSPAAAGGVTCRQPLADVASRFLPGKSADEAARPGSLPACFHVARLEGAEAVVISARMAEDVAVGWKHGRRWTLRPAELDGSPPSGGSIALIDGRADVFLQLESGDLLHGREDGRSQGIRFQAVTAQSDGGPHQYEFLRHDLVLHTYAGGAQPPLAWTGAANLPANAQELFRWDGERLVLMGRRTFPEPHLTANSFLGALQAGDVAGAARYAVEPGVVSKAQRLLGESPHLWTDAEDTSPGSLKWVVRRAEMHNWDRLPQTTRIWPPTTYTFPINRGRECVLLQMARTTTGWIIIDLAQKKAPGRLTAPGASLRL